MMPYRTPIVTGDRVAIAPHHDLWMAGCRFGRVERIQITDTERDDALVYNVRLDTGRLVALAHEDLLGAVAGTPVGGDATSSIDPWDGKRDLNGDTYAEHMVKFNERQSFGDRYAEDREAGGL